MKLVVISGLFFIILVSCCYAECQDSILEYKECYDEHCGTGYVKKEGCADACKEILTRETECVEEEEDTCMKNECQVIIESDFDGVSADGISTINFRLDVSGNYEDFEIYIKAKEGETLRGDIEEANGIEIYFTPTASNDAKNYLTPQSVEVIGWCVPKQATCETELPDKVYSRKEFTIEQPPLFFVHGIWSSAEVWGTFKQRAGRDGWWYGDISYESTDDNKYNAKLLSDDLEKFIKKVRDGGAYNGKKISSTKVDIVSHSMGGLVTRYYIGSYMYKGDIRKFLMMGTPNNGEVDLTILSKIFQDWKGNQFWTTVKQLRPDDPFITELNEQPLNKSIEYHTIAGTGWYTYTFSSKLTTWRGDGVVLVDSVKLPGVPLYCTYDTHADWVRWIRLLLSADPIVALRGFDTRDDITITTSEVAYGIAKNALLYGGAISAVDCNEDLYTKKWYNPILQYIAELHSPATLHAYDEKGNHLGLNKKGQLENTIGKGVYYLANSSIFEGQVIKVIGDKKINFVVVGNSTGEISLTFTSLSANGSVTEKNYENISINDKTQYSFDISSENPELMKEEIKPEKQRFSRYMLVITVVAIIFGIILIIGKKLKKK